ncbi:MULTISPECIES: MBL fold metallo-hydrolase [unclassified Xanthobacter]|uniref:MBL fold metallo-hydrolase n=1 Tax=unclassified Xanthobacter TaxID=2623496 RepID=UPI001EDD4D6B|nr:MULTISPECIES: MBL fold metallo-hydrolase [unclassified Xanthobacter]
MTSVRAHAPATFPVPEIGDVTAICEDVLWTRLRLPFQLDHVNVYFLRDGAGWAAIDTGLDDTPTRDAWRALLEGPLGDGLTRVICTHAHPDHVGLARHLCGAAQAPLHIHPVEHAAALALHHPLPPQTRTERAALLDDLGLDPASRDHVLAGGDRYRRMTEAPPAAFHPLTAGWLLLGGDRWEVAIGGGHSPAMATLLNREKKLFIAADQVLERISPNVGISVFPPCEDPLADYLASLDAVLADVPDDVLVLPGHGVPFFGLHQRVRALQAHHARSLRHLVAHCQASGPSGVMELLPVMYTRPIPLPQMGFALSELLSHIRHLVRTDHLRWTPDGHRLAPH